MEHPLCNKTLERAGRWLRAGLLCFALFAVETAPAATVSGLYDAQVPVADRSERARNEAFGAALGAVAVRVTGRSDAAARLGAAAIATARRYVQRYGYAGGGLLDVGFESAGIDQLLEQQGLPVWGRERPSIVVILPSAIAGAVEARTAVEQAARARGIPLVWASESSESLNAAGQLVDVAARYRADGVLVGRLLSDASAAVLKWSFVLGNAQSEAQGSWADGVNLAADNAARLFAVTANSTNQVTLDVAGISDLDAYAKTLNYLGGLSLVRAVGVESVARDVVRFKLSLRGDQNALRRTIALDQRLQAESSADQLSFRYRP